MIIYKYLLCTLGVILALPILGLIALALMRKSVMSHTEIGVCRTVAGEGSAVVWIVPYVFGILRSALSFR